MTQSEQIKKHLEKGMSITSLEALTLYSCFRLASRVNDLRKQGLIIHSVMVKSGKKRFAKYFLENKK